MGLNKINGREKKTRRFHHCLYTKIYRESNHCFFKKMHLELELHLELKHQYQKTNFREKYYDYNNLLKE